MILERPVTTSDAQTRGSNASKCMENQPVMWSSSSSSSSIVITKKSRDFQLIKKFICF